MLPMLYIGYRYISRYYKSCINFFFYLPTTNIGKFILELDHTLHLFSYLDS